MHNHSKAVETATPERATNKARHSNIPDPNKAMVDKLRQVAETRALKAKSTLGLYSLKTKDGRFYGVPYCAVSDHYALLAQKQVCPLTDCFRLGTVCLFDGLVTSEKKPVLILDKGV